MSTWTADDLVDQSGRTFIVTGAASGIGLETARQLAGHGARVIAGVRNTAAAQDAIDFDSEIRKLDLADLASVRHFADSIDEPVDVLINNAGVMGVPLMRTADGFEMQIGTNHLGHFALTGLLLPAIRDRVVTVSSTAHRTGSIRLDDLNWHESYQRWPAYGQSKLANLLFTSELQRRLTASGSRVRALAAHPGYSATALQSKTDSWWQNGFMKVTNRLIAQSPAAGAWPSLYAATVDLPGDTFVGPDGMGQVRGHPKPVERSVAAQDADTARQLWEISEDLTGVHYAFVE